MGDFPQVSSSVLPIWQLVSPSASDPRENKKKAEIAFMIYHQKSLSFIYASLSCLHEPTFKGGQELSSPTLDERSVRNLGNYFKTATGSKY